MFLFLNPYHLSYIPFVSGEDGRSRAEQLLHILRQLDPYVSSSLEHQRRRGCVAVQEVLVRFRNLCSGGFGALGSYPSFTMNKQIDQGGSRSLSSLPCMPNDFLRLLYKYMISCL
jgi:maestro heat-like repeat-containing protein family member 1